MSLSVSDLVISVKLPFPYFPQILIHLKLTYSIAYPDLQFVI